MFASGGLRGGLSGSGGFGRSCASWSPCAGLVGLWAWSGCWLPFLSVLSRCGGVWLFPFFWLGRPPQEGGAVRSRKKENTPCWAGFALASAGAAALAAAGGSFFGVRGFLLGVWVPLGFRFPLAGLAGWRFFFLGRRVRAWFLSFGLVVVASLGGCKARRRARRRRRYAGGGCWVGAVPAVLAVWGGVFGVLGAFLSGLVVAAMGCVNVLCGRVPRRAILLCRHRKSGRARLLPANGKVVKIKHLENLFAQLV